MLRRIFITAILVIPLGCAHHHHSSQDKDDKQAESKEDREARQLKEAAIAAKQAADNVKFQKGLAVVRTIKPGEAAVDFYRKLSDARLTLERVDPLPDGRRERYSFIDNNTAFLTVVVKADHITELKMEGVAPASTQP